MIEELSEAENLSSVANTDLLRDYGTVVTQGEFCLQTVVIAGQIEGHTLLPPPVKATRYEHLLPLLVKAEESGEVDGILFLINTVGGDVEAGLAIAEMIRGMTKPSVSLVLGGGHSIGIPLAVSAKESLVVPSATMTVHPVRINGLVLGAPQSFDYLRRMQDRICDFVVENSSISRIRLEELMQGRSDMATDIGTILSGEEAVSCGLIDRMASFSQALTSLKKQIRQKKQ